MSVYFIWAVAGFVLIIAELLTGTFYLLVLGVAALVGALVAFAGGPFWLQAGLTAAAALIGIYLVHLWRQKQGRGHKDSNNLDIGQTVVLETWVDQAHGLARVKYRGTSWDAKAPSSAQVNDTLTIAASEGTLLHVTSHRP